MSSVAASHPYSYTRVFVFFSSCDPWLGLGYYWSTYGNHVAWSWIHAIGRERERGGQWKEGREGGMEREREREIYLNSRNLAESMLENNKNNKKENWMHLRTNIFSLESHFNNNLIYSEN